jgi:hypothetical protein
MFCWLKALATLTSRKRSPADPQTVYRIGSVTESFTALMLMQLRDAGELALSSQFVKQLFRTSWLRWPADRGLGCDRLYRPQSYLEVVQKEKMK